MKLFLTFISILFILLLSFNFFDKNEKLQTLSKAKQENQTKLEIANPYKDVANKIIKDVNAKTDREKVIAINNWFGEKFASPKPKQIPLSIDEKFNLMVGQCQTVSIFMKKILYELGIASRVISIFNIDNANSADSHAVIEVFYKNRWHLFDPTYSAYYVQSNATMEILSLSQLMTISSPIKGCFYNTWRRKKFSSNLIVEEKEFFKYVPSTGHLLHLMLARPELYKKLKYSTIYYDNRGFGKITFNKPMQIGRKEQDTKNKWNDLLPMLTGNIWFGMTADNEKKVLRFYFEDLKMMGKYRLNIDTAYIGRNNTEMLISVYDGVVPNRRLKSFNNAGDSNDRIVVDFVYMPGTYIQVEVLDRFYIYLDAQELKEIK